MGAALKLNKDANYKNGVDKRLSNYKKILSKYEVHIVDTYYKPLGITKDEVATAIIMAKDMGMSMENLKKVMKLKIKNQADPAKEMLFMIKNFISFDEDEKKRFFELDKKYGQLFR